MQLASPHRFAAVAKEAGLGARACSWLGGSGQATIEHMRASHLAEDVAEAIVATLELPPHANVDLLTLKPVAQAAQHKTFRGPLQVRRD